MQLFSEQNYSVEEGSEKREVGSEKREVGSEKREERSQKTSYLGLQSCLSYEVMDTEDGSTTVYIPELNETTE